MTSQARRVLGRPEQPGTPDLAEVRALVSALSEQLAPDQVRSLKNICDRLERFHQVKGRRQNKGEGMVPVQAHGRPWRERAIVYVLLSTGLRREEVMGLRGRDVQVTEEGLVIGGRVKGGRYRAREVRDPETRAALLDYLTTAGRLHVLKADAPVWTRHDNPKLAGEPLTSHAFARNLKLYARKVGIDNVHLHQTRHTFGRIVAEETGSMTATQDALDHANLSTTTVYVQRIAVKSDLHSAAVARRRKGASAT